MFLSQDPVLQRFVKEIIVDSFYAWTGFNSASWSRTTWHGSGGRRDRFLRSLSRDTLSGIMIWDAREIHFIPTLNRGSQNKEPISTRILKCERSWYFRNPFFFPAFVSPMCEIILFIFKIIFSFYFVTFPGFIGFDWFLASQSQVSDRKTKGTWLPFSQRDTIRFSWEFSTMFSCSEALFSFVGHFLKSWEFHWFPASQAWEHPCLVPSHHHPMFLFSFFGGVACLSLLFFLPVFRLFGAERRGREGK